MKFERARNAKRNIIAGMILKIYQYIIPFIIRTLLIYFLGIQYLGLNSLFASVLQVLNLAELGVGSAMVYSMYEPLAKDNIKKINSLMLLYKRYYYYIGLFILIFGSALTPFIPHLISGDLPSDVNIYILYWIQLSSTVISYWLFAYKNCLLSATQRNDIMSIITIIVNSIMYVLQVCMLVFFKNYYLYIIISPIMQATNNIVTACVVNKVYPQFKAEGKLSRNETVLINQRMKDIFTAKIGGVVVGSADTIVISAFLGLSVLAIYQNYYFVVTAIIGIISVFLQSCTAGIGNSFVVDGVEKTYHDFLKLTFLFMLIINSASCCFLNLFQNFIKLWVGSEFLLPYSMVILFVVYFVSQELMNFFSLYKDSSGMWHEDRLRPLCEAGLNLILNLIMVQYWGLYGIVLSTIISMVLFSIPWLIHNLFSIVFKKSLFAYLRIIFANLGVIVISNIFTYTLCKYIRFTGISGLALKLSVSCVCSVFIYILFFHKNKVFLEALDLLNRISGYRINFLVKLLENCSVK